MIKQVSYTNFCQHQNKIVDFSKGLNLIVGENTSGKSNLIEGISFSSFGKSNHSILDKIINYQAKSASVEVEHTEYKCKRTRINKLSKLSLITQQELQTKLNLSYEEYLRLFYLSRHEATKLFDASYLKQFLISLFNLNKYTKIYERLKTEYSILKQLKLQYKSVNKKLYGSRLSKIGVLLQKYKQQKINLQQDNQKYLKCKEQLNILQGKLDKTKQDFNKDVNKLKWDKCYTCNRPITAIEKNILAKELQFKKPKIIANEKLLKEKSARLTTILNGFYEQTEVLNKKINKCLILQTKIQEKLKEKKEYNSLRIKELEQILPIFYYNGFPTYLLRTYIPVIQETANNLLSFIFNDLTIKIRTHKPNSDIPDFKVAILRNDVEVGTLDDVSGAEAVLVNICLRLGIIVIFKQLNNTCIDWLIIDEGLDKVDEKNSDKILCLLQNFINLGYIEQIILVTHKKELKELDNVNYIKLNLNNEY